MTFVRRIAVLVVLSAACAASAQQWLSLCSKCVNPIITSKSGIGTARATAEAKVTRQAVVDWCGNWQPDDKTCVAAQMKEPDNTVYRATADCTRGALHAIDNSDYALAGTWPGGIGKGRTRWRGTDGQIVGDDNASGGLSLSQQWEVLCPGVTRATATATAAPAAVRAASLCAGRERCTETAAFAATVMDFRLSRAGRFRVLNLTLRFQNKTARPLILGYANDSGMAIDDRGNRYVVDRGNGVQGMGRIAGDRVDPKFVLQPGESSDARFELLWAPDAHDIYGTSWDLAMTIREIVPIEGDQFRLGTEHAIQFPHLVDGVAPGNAGTFAAGVPAQPENAAGPAMPAAVMPDACGGAPRCYSAGPFTATAVSVAGARLGNNTGDHTLHITLRIRNVSNALLVLAYAQHTSTALDNLGNTYYSNRAGAPDRSAQGIGMVSGNNADPQFVLQPGQSRDASFDLRRFDSGRAVLGTAFTYHVTLTQLEVLPSQQLRSARDYVLEFQNLNASGGAQQLNDTLRKLGGLFHR